MASNITVNGEPLEIYRDREVNAEIHEEREKATKVKLYRGIKTKSTRSNGKTPRDTGTIVYTAGQRETHVLMLGTKWEWASKAPFVSSGKSVFGGIEYDQSTKEVKCHECGAWRSRIGSHIHVHQMTTIEYKLKHGLKKSTRLASPDVPKIVGQDVAKVSSLGLAKMAANRLRRGPSVSVAKWNIPRYASWAQGASPEMANVMGKCRAQLKNELNKLYLFLGRTPTMREMAENKLYRGILIRAFGIPVRDIFIELGMVPRKSWERSSVNA